MASRRQLKAMIHDASSELLFACNICLVSNPKFTEAVFYDTATRIAEMHSDFIARINHPNGTHDKQLTRTYYRSLIQDFDKQVDTFIKELNAFLEP